MHYEPPRSRVGAFVRVKNEIKTLKASLDSIDGVFDHIVIVYSNEPDDGSIALLTEWCQKRSVCESHAYPHVVIPSHDTRYREKVAPENTLAAYLNFGLDFFEPDEWVVKIDADQVYMTERLKKIMTKLKNPKNQGKRFGLMGYNTFSWHGQLVKYRKHPLNGGEDSFILQRRYFAPFSQQEYSEVLETSTPLARTFPPVWFHFMKSLKSNGRMRANDEATLEEVKPLSLMERKMFELFIRSYLGNSPYADIKI